MALPFHIRLTTVNVESIRNAEDYVEKKLCLSCSLGNVQYEGWVGSRILHVEIHNHGEKLKNMSWFSSVSY